MTPLEARYRRLLRLLPPSYRAVRGEEMVDTFLLSMREDDPDDDTVVQACSHPSWDERFSIVGLACRLRLGGYRAPERYEVQGGAVRWLVSALLLIQAVSAGLMLFGYVWIAQFAPWAAASDQWTAPRLWAAGLLGLLWLPAFVALTLRQTRVAQVLAALATAPLLAAVLAQTGGFVLDSSDRAPGLLVAWMILLVEGGIVLGLAAFHPEAPGLRPRPWLGSAAVALVVLAVAGFVPEVAGPVLVGAFSLWCLGAILGAVAFLVVARGWTAVRRSEALLGLSLLCGIAFVLNATATADLVFNGGGGSLPASLRVGLVTQLVLVVVIGLAFAVAGARGVRRLPKVAYSQT